MIGITTKKKLQYKIIDCVVAVVRLHHSTSVSKSQSGWRHCFLIYSISIAMTHNVTKKKTAKLKLKNMITLVRCYLSDRITIKRPMYQNLGFKWQVLLMSFSYVSQFFFFGFVLFLWLPIVFGGIWDIVF